MEKSKLLNRRFLYIETHDLKVFPQIIECVDGVIDESMQLDSTTSQCIIYGNSTEQFFIGREVVGNDPNIIFHDDVKIKDFSETEGVIHNDAFLTITDLLKFISSNLKLFSDYRISFMTLDEVEVFFFNLEK